MRYHAERGNDGIAWYDGTPLIVPTLRVGMQPRTLRVP